ncbi:MAG: hypothetical protein RIQ79_786, partial [Verrucomicrobiota bacterium]
MSREKNLFKNYTQLESYLPVAVWQALRYLSILAALGCVVLLVFKPALGLNFFWNVAVVSLPLVFLFAPGIWRNLCPLAATNQLPRLTGRTRGWSLSDRWKANAFVVGMTLFLVLVVCRKIFFNTSGLATAALLGGALLGALVGGLLFKGKSGWCSTFCPVLPVQRLYGQNPYLQVANSHCQPCVGCAKNCYDFNPTMAPLADQYDDDRHYVGFRRFFAGLFPGFILAYFLVPGTPANDVLTLFWQTGIYMAVSLASFHLLDHAFHSKLNRMVTVYAALALNCYYWFAGLKLYGALHSFGLSMPDDDVFVWLVRMPVAILSGLWVVRTGSNERLFLRKITGELTTVNVQVGGAAEAALGENAGRRAAAALRIDPEGRTLNPKPKQTVLEAVEGCGLKLESGCRMGVCGADPVAVTSGFDALSPISGEEKSTLERLGLAKNTRMACCARIQGAVTVELKPHPREASAVAAPPVKFDP